MTIDQLIERLTEHRENLLLTATYGKCRATDGVLHLGRLTIWDALVEGHRWHVYLPIGDKLCPGGKVLPEPRDGDVRSRRSAGKALS